MEDTHWGDASDGIHLQVLVLILVLMEDTHWALSFLYANLATCLNPCFNGRYSLSMDILCTGVNFAVLILVLMEDTHWDMYVNEEIVLGSES